MMKTLRIVKKAVLVSISLFLFAICSCSGNKSPDIEELQRIHSALEELDRIEELLVKGGLRSRHMGVLYLYDVTADNSPEDIVFGIEQARLDLFSDFLLHLDKSALNSVSMSDPRSLQRKAHVQAELRADIFSSFMRTMAFLSDDSMRTLFYLLSTCDEQQMDQIQMIIRDQDLAYYKNIKQITGPTADRDRQVFYTVTLNYGYEQGNKKIQTLINQNKLLITDITRNYFSSLTEEEIMYGSEFLIKARLLILLNKEILQYDNKNELFGIQDIAVLEMQTFDLR